MGADPSGIQVSLGPPRDGRCEIRVATATTSRSFVFEERGRDAIADLICAVDRLARGQPSHAYLFSQSSRLELRFEPTAGSATVRLELWLAHRDRTGTGQAVFSAVVAAREVAHAFWSVLRAFEERERHTDPSSQWAHRFPTQRMAVLTRHITGVASGLGSPGGRTAHATLRYARSVIDPAAARVFDLRYVWPELVPEPLVEQRLEEVRRLGGRGEQTALVEHRGKYWFLEARADALDEVADPNEARHLVESTEGVLLVLDRGYALRVIGGPYPTLRQAEDHMEDAWDSRDGPR